jgi:hypothetical protein
MSFGARGEISVQDSHSHLPLNKAMKTVAEQLQHEDCQISVVQNTAKDNSICCRKLRSIGVSRLGLLQVTQLEWSRPTHWQCG